VGGPFWMRTSASLPFSPRPAGRACGSHPPGRRSGPSDLGRLRSGSRGRVPPHPSSPRASARGASSWPRGRRHASSGLGRPISSAIDRPSLWRSSSRTLRSALSPRRPPPPVLQFFNGFFNGEGRRAHGRVADPQVLVVAPGLPCIAELPRRRRNRWRAQTGGRMRVDARGSVSKTRRRIDQSFTRPAVARPAVGELEETAGRR